MNTQNQKRGALGVRSQLRQKIGRGFDDPVHDAHATFRAIMTALAEPGKVRVTPSPADAPAALSPAMTAIALALTDFETPVWCDAGPEVEAYIGFHTGAPMALSPSAAAFALITRPERAPRLSAFAAGSLDFPDRSTTIVVAIDDIATDAGWYLTGPGVASARRLLVAPLGESMRTEILANRARFPCGLDFLFCRDATVVGLPRSTHIDQKVD
ncbi:MAG: phosphonate C-P lyase system protein PhnH [Hyphomicrobiaceae bacterium]|nr:phosphonate C-P lyase system protein PhnH [Hyphomicrobiaceae bacterium]